MRSTTVTLQRTKVTQRTKIPVQITNMAWRVAQELGGESPYDSFWISTTGGGKLDVRRGDLLIDETEIDPLTSTNTRYRVFGQVEMFDQSHAKIPAERIIGT